MRRRYTYIARTLTLTAVVAGCGKLEAGDPQSTTSACTSSLESLQSTVFAKACNGAGCHSDIAPGAELDLFASGLEQRLVAAASSNCDGWLRVDPGAPESSLLVRKLVDDEPPCGERMPPGVALSEDELDCVRAWVAGLDPNACETCGGTQCVALSSDPSHCGACDVVCPAGSPCQNGSCVCAAGLLACAGTCTDVTTDPSHCGRCGATCGAGATCQNGECLCSSGLSACEGSCVDPQSAASHCGGCGQACSPSTVCLAGQCSDGCGSLSQCGSSCVDLGTDLLNCGSCGAACPSGLSCVAGTCACPSPTAETCNGVCVEAQSDPKNCGACGNACSPGEVCLEGRCSCTTSTSVAFKTQIEPILVTSCSDNGCHSGRRPQADLLLSAGSVHGELVNVATDQCNGSRTLVTPGSASASYLMNKLTGSGMCSGTQMPKAGQSLPAAELAAISAWICAGAAND
jgi:hypothetical protein